jgi:molecular chaperone DnaK
MTALIPRNTTIPAKKSEVFSTAVDNQPNVEVHVLQGERPLARDNRTLGRFHLTGLPPAPRGVPQIEVTFDIDSNGIVNVSARDLASAKEQKIQITSSSGLSKEEVDRLVKEAQSHATEDQKRRELIDARNEADALAYQVEKTLSENQQRIPAEDRSRIEAAIAEVRKAAQAEDLDVIKRSISDLQRASHALAEVLYQSQQQQQQRQQGGPTTPGADASGVAEGEVVDAETVDT